MRHRFNITYWLQFRIIQNINYNNAINFIIIIFGALVRLSVIFTLCEHDRVQILVVLSQKLNWESVMLKSCPSVRIKNIRELQRTKTFAL